MLRTCSFWFLVTAACSASAASPEIAFKDLNGRAVLLSAPARSTVTLPMPAGPTFATVQQGTQGLSGMHDATHNNLPTMLLPQMFPALSKVRHDITRGSGFVPNVESLLEIQPDMVWQWGHMGQELLAPIEAAGLTVGALRYGTEENTQQWITLFAQSTGHPERGQTMNVWRQQVRHEVEAQVADIAPSKRLKVMHLSRYKTGLAVAGQAGNFQADIGIAGGYNVNDSKAGAPIVNVEQLLLWNPDMIVLTNFEHDLKPETLYSDPMLASLTAIQQQRVYKVPAGGYYWDAPSQDSPLYWIWLAKLMYPDAVTLDLRAEMRRAYQMLYGHAVTDAQIDQALHLRVNRSSQSYARIFERSAAPGSPPAPASHVAHRR